MQLRRGLGGLHAAAARFAAAERVRAALSPVTSPQGRHTIAAAAGHPSGDAAVYDGPIRGRLFLIDAKAQVYRLSHGYGEAARPQPTAAAAASGASPPPVPGSGEEASLVAHGFVQILLNLFNMKPPPTHMAVVVDAPGANFRSLMYPDYKAQRSEAPAGLKEDLGRILDVVDALGVPILSVPGVEADDVIGSLAVRGAQEGLEVTIVSPDKDFFQLLSPRVRLMRLIKAPKKVSLHPGNPFYTLEDFEAEHQLGDARLWADVMALQGDESDNIPGVRGIGAKTALRLVQSCGGVEAVLADGTWEGVKLNTKQRAILSSEDGRDAARLSKQLVTIATDLKQPAVTAPMDSFQLRVPADGGTELMARMQYYGLQWSGKRLQQTLAAWAASGGSPPLVEAAMLTGSGDG